MEGEGRGSPMGDCIRCGTCCQDVRLAEGPDMLQTAYEYWLKTPKIDPKFSEIYLIFPMLEFKFENPEEDLPYHYRCKHYTEDENGLGCCSIHAFRPKMCAGFPHYDEVEHLDRDEALSPYEGCGYNE